ncbi:MAG: cytochrome c-type biogenesis protein CcmH [Rhodospirillaceae bacterium]|nr:MAG: cytochrome c-type biogenesis protein CcmH [Rhodospirillaceae bacterium]
MAVLTFGSASFAVRPDEMLSDPALEARAEAISRDIRCVVCQGESIEDSDADIAHELRVIVREQLKAGATDDQVQEYLVARYGDFVLLKPPFKAKTAFIWTGPFLLLLGGGIGICLYFRRVARAEVTPLNVAEQARLEGFLKVDDDYPNPDRDEPAP